MTAVLPSGTNFLMDADVIAMVETSIAQMGRHHGVFADAIKEYRVAKRRFNLAVSAKYIDIVYCELKFADFQRALKNLTGPLNEEDSMHEDVQQQDDDGAVQQQETVMKLATPQQIRASGRIDFDAVQVVDRGNGTGRGVYAAKKIEKDKTLASYGGVFETASSVNRASRYRLHYSRNLIIDGDPSLPESQGHIGNFLNDARGPTKIHDRNNASFRSGFIFVNGKRIRTVWLVATRNIEIGEEICVYYGKGYWGMHAE